MNRSRQSIGQRVRRRRINQSMEEGEEDPELAQILNEDNNGPQQIIREMEEEAKHDEEVQPQQQQQQPQQQQKQIEIPQQNPLLDNQMLPQVQEYNPQRFLLKIPNTKVLREFLICKGQYYCPPIKDLTDDFCTKLLAGQKKLLKMKDVIFVDQVPKWPEFSSKRLWVKAQQNPSHSIYFPDFSSQRYPQRKYLLNVINTVSKNSVIQAVYQIRKKREKEGIEQQPIKLTNEFATLLSQFVSVSCDQKRKGLRLRKRKIHDQCTLCLQPMKKQNQIANFPCLRHKAHGPCIAQYLNSENGKKSKYLCPLRCNNAGL